MKKTMTRLFTLFMAMVMVIAMSASVFAASISSKEALAKALNNADLKKSQVKHIDVELEHGKYEIEFTRKSNNVEYDYEVSASTGKILEKNVDYNIKYKRSGKKIGKTAAMKKAAKSAGVKLSVVKKGTCKYDEGKYEVKFKSSTRRYEYEIAATSGKIVEYGWELR